MWVQVAEEQAEAFALQERLKMPFDGVERIPAEEGHDREEREGCEKTWKRQSWEYKKHMDGTVAVEVELEEDLNFGDLDRNLDMQGKKNKKVEEEEHSSNEA